MSNLAAGLARSTCSGNLFGTQFENHLQGLYADLVNHRFDDVAGALDQVDDGKQDLTVGLAELLNDGGRLARGAGHDVVRFLHGGWFLSVVLFRNRILSNRCPPPLTNLQLNSGRPPYRREDGLSYLNACYQ